jgi:hypothetical protein
MTFIAPDGARTVTNGSTYDARKVYEITASVVLDVIYSENNEVHRTGETKTEVRTYHVVATSEPLALALYYNRWGSAFQRHTLMTVTPLFVIDEEISTKHG